MNIYNKNEALESNTDDGMFTHAHAEEYQPPCHCHLYHSLTIWLFRLVLLSRSAVRFFQCFHLTICASTPVTLIFILTLRVTSLDSRPKRRQIS